MTGNGAQGARALCALETSRKERQRDMSRVLDVQNVEKYYGNKGNLTKAIDNISFFVEKVNLWELWERPDPERPRC